jgi:hypothetical protein
LQDNPQICKRLFGIKFGLLETIPHNTFLLENPTSNWGLNGFPIKMKWQGKPALLL